MSGCRSSHFASSVTFSVTALPLPPDALPGAGKDFRRFFAHALPVIAISRRSFAKRRAFHRWHRARSCRVSPIFGYRSCRHFAEPLPLIVCSGGGADDVCR